MTTSRTYAGEVAAPEFPDGLEWVNTDRGVDHGRA